MSLMGTAFQRAVWKACAKIPKGKVASYADIARAVGRPKAVRAVGNALNANPRAPEVPCHRVIRSDGRIGGYAHGTRKKMALLLKERIKIKKELVSIPNPTMD
ncbi:MAG TPA: MGMT family protein [Candidatus Bilamarchaeaceae archaeon]|nr:MGMT family protein [Candidatus Bilamarchaeaceae archaeon]